MPTTTNHGGGDDEDCPSPPRRSGSGIGGGVKSDFKKMVASVFSRIQGTDAFRKMKLRHNTDANIKLVKDLKHAVYIKPEHKLGHSENHGHHLPHHSSESESDVASIRSSEGGHKKVHFEDLVEEIRYKGSVLGEHMREAIQSRDNVLNILGVDPKAPAVQQACDTMCEGDEVMAAVLNRQLQKGRDIESVAQEGQEEVIDANGTIRTYIKLESSDVGLEQARSLRSKAMRTSSLRSSDANEGFILGGQVAPQVGGHGTQACSLIINEEFTAVHGEVSLQPISTPVKKSSSVDLVRSQSLPSSRLTPNRKSSVDPMPLARDASQNSSGLDATDAAAAVKDILRLPASSPSSFSPKTGGGPTVQRSFEAVVPPPGDATRADRWSLEGPGGDECLDPSFPIMRLSSAPTPSSVPFQRVASQPELKSFDAIVVAEVKASLGAGRALGEGEGEGEGRESIAAQVSKKLSRLTKASSVITLNELTKANVVARTGSDSSHGSCSSLDSSDDLTLRVKANQIHSPTLSFDGDAVVKRMAASPAIVPKDQQNQHHKVGGVGHGQGRFSSPALDGNSPRSPSKNLSPLMHPVPKTTPEDSEAVFTPSGGPDSEAGSDDGRRMSYLEAVVTPSRSRDSSRRNSLLETSPKHQESDAAATDSPLLRFGNGIEDREDRGAAATAGTPSGSPSPASPAIDVRNPESGTGRGVAKPSGATMVRALSSQEKALADKAMSMFFQAGEGDDSEDEKRKEEEEEEEEEEEGDGGGAHRPEASEAARKDAASRGEGNLGADGARVSMSEEGEVSKEGEVCISTKFRGVTVKTEHEETVA